MRPSSQCGQIDDSPNEMVAPFAGDAKNVSDPITIIIVIAVINVINAQLDILSARWLKKHFQRCMIAHVKLTEGVEVLRLYGT